MYHKVSAPKIILNPNRFTKIMCFETKLFRYFAEIICNLKEKILTVQSSLSFVLFSLFTGFLSGNLFGTFLEKFRSYFWWNGFVGLFILLFIEIINALVYGFSRREYGNFSSEAVSSPRKKREPEQDFISSNSQTYRFPNTPLLKKSPGKHWFYTITQIKRTINSFKIGLLFGFFVDSFKVGS